MASGSSSSSNASNAANPQPLLYRNRDSLHVGELFRYLVTYTPNKDRLPELSAEGYSLWVKVKNLESVALRAAYLTGPYILYTDVRPHNYDQNSQAYTSADQPVYEPQLKAGQAFYAQLFMNTVSSSYTWTVDVVSQIIFSPSSSVHFELMVGRTKESVQQPATGPLANSVTHDHLYHKQYPQSRPFTDAYGTLQIRRLDTIDIWNSPQPVSDRPVHLVVVTHGLHSNVGADMLYIKEKIDEMAHKTGENVIVRGYFDNACKTEKGIKYLGRRLADYVAETLVPSLESLGVPLRISFIAHSLGGLVQTFALAHIQSTYPDFFTKRIEPVHFICIATPFLGLSNENPVYVKFVLDSGFIGKSGRDLGLSWKVSHLNKHKKPLLRILPTGPAHAALLKFKSRTIYANAVNDGIVPLRTSAILYIDWKGISKAARARRGEEPTTAEPKEQDEGEAEEAPEAEEIPDFDNDSQESEKPGEVDKPAASTTNGPFEIFNSILSVFAPQAGSKSHGRSLYKRSQTVGNGSDEDVDEESILAYIPKSASAIESGISVLAPPLPPTDFINDPSSRPPTIFHDKVYTEADLPPRTFQKRSSLRSLTSRSLLSRTASGSSSGSAEPNAEVFEKSKQEERLAREWHRHLSWRKVLVNLKPDAHNNIVVRRRFANAFGWPVIDHLVENHFGPDGPTSSAQARAAAVFARSGSPGFSSVMGSPRLETPFQKRTKKPEEKSEIPPDWPENGRDLASMTFDLDLDSDNNSVVTEMPNYHHPSVSSVTTTSSVNSDVQAWDSHLKVTEQESDDEGFVPTLGSVLDSLRGVTVPMSLKPKLESTEPLDSETVEERINSLM